MAYSEEEEAVVIRRLPGEDPTRVREIRINCPDATGLGADIMRLIFDFGLRILSADISVDGTWCFLIIKVTLSSRMHPRWALLKSRLEEICPASSDALRTIIGRDERPIQQHPFAVRVSSTDRHGMLHALSHALWEADTSVFKAHIVTTPDGEVRDDFFVVDNRRELPADHRILEICDRVKGVLGPDTHCYVEPLPIDTLVSSGSSEAADANDTYATDERPPVGPRLCKLSSSQLNLHVIAKHRKRGSIDVASSLEEPLTFEQEWERRSHYDSTQQQEAGMQHPSFSPPPPPPGSCCSLPVASSPASAAAIANVAIEYDNSVSPSYTMLTLHCPDRKGLAYDLFVALKELGLRIAYARINVDCESCIAALDLFVQDADGQKVSDDVELMELVERLRCAAALPVRIEVEEIEGGHAAQLTVAAPVDSGGRGRPRVTYDVTQGLCSANIAVDSADVYVENMSESSPPTPASPVRAQEVHRFRVRLPGGGSLDKKEDRDALREAVRGCLLGTRMSASAGTGWYSEQEQHRQQSEISPPLGRCMSAHWKGIQT